VDEIPHVARMREKRNAYGLLVGKPEGRRPLERHRRTWLDNIRMDLVEVGWGDVDWIGLAQDRGRWRARVDIGIEPSGFIKCWETTTRASPRPRVFRFVYMYSLLSGPPHV
jgi:hypothetical protein